MQVRVIRTIPRGSRPALPRGTVRPASDFRNLESLIGQGYLEVIADPPTGSPVQRRHAPAGASRRQDASGSGPALTRSQARRQARQKRQAKAEP